MVNTALAQGRGGDKWKLDEMSWPEVRAAIDAGRTTVIAAAGSMEQHGPHLPLQTDTLLGTFLVEAIVQRVPGAFQGPTIPFGVSNHHMPFAGTITLDEDAFKTVVRQYAESLAHHGFENIVIIPSHGGNFGPLRDLAQELETRVGNARFIAFSDLMLFMEFFNRTSAAEGIDPGIAGAHAGEAETSMVLAANQDLVQMDYAIEGYVGDFGPEAASTIFTEGMPALTDNGILGDARPADRSRGFRYRDTLG